MTFGQRLALASLLLAAALPFAACADDVHVEGRSRYEAPRATGPMVIDGIGDEAAGVAESGAPKDVVWMLDYLFATVLDGRNAYVTDGVQRALGRAPKDFADYARDIAATDLWRAVA